MTTATSKPKTIRYPGPLFGRYTVGYPDPPWSYDDKAHAGERGVEYNYPTMDLDALKKLTIEGMAAPYLFANDAALFMWATCPLLPEALELMGAWEFEYTTVAFVWVKTATGPSKTGVKWGMGNWTRCNAEVVLLGTRGDVARVSKGVHQIVYEEPRVFEGPSGQHSAKPFEVRNRIEELIGHQPRLELFSRDKVAGWDRWGLDVNKELTIERDTTPARTND